MWAPAALWADRVQAASPDSLCPRAVGERSAMPAYGTAKDYADLGRLGGVSRSRISQIMNLRNLAPSLQELILLPSVGRHTGDALNEHSLRRISALVDWREQIVKFEQFSARQYGQSKA